MPAGVVEDEPAAGVSDISQSRGDPLSQVEETTASGLAYDTASDCTTMLSPWATTCPSPFLRRVDLASVGVSPDTIVMPGRPVESCTTLGKPAWAGWSAPSAARGKAALMSNTITTEPVAPLKMVVAWS